MKYSKSIWKDQVALVTGGSSGIGFEISRQLAQQGVHVWIVARRKEVMETALKEIEAARQSPSQRFGFFSADVSDAAQAAAAIEYVTAQAGVPYLVVNSAGITYPGNVQDLPLEIFRSMMDVNYFGTVYITKAVLPGMIVRGSGHIINISSIAGFLGTYGYSAYGAAKYAVRGFSDVLRSEVKPLGIRVSVVFPPDTDTPQLAFEEPLKPPVTKILVGIPNIRSPQLVANNIIRQAAQGRYTIMPAFDSKWIYFLASHLGDMAYPVMDWLIARARKQLKNGKNPTT